VIVSNDSDLKEPNELAQSEFGISVGVVNPHPAEERSLVLKPTFFKQLRASALKRSQFPDRILDALGAIQKPSAW